MKLRPWVLLFTAGFAVGLLWIAFMLLHLWHEWTVAARVVALVQSRCATCATQGDVWRMYLRPLREFVVLGLGPPMILLLVYLAIFLGLVRKRQPRATG